MNLLMVDDDTLFLEKLKETVHFKEIGIDLVLTAGNIRQAMDILQKYPVDILLSDIEMPQGSGLELLQWIRERQFELECIFLSSYAYFAYAQKAIALKSSEYLLKPVSESELEKALKGIADKKRETNQTEKKAHSEEADFWLRVLKGECTEEELWNKEPLAALIFARQRDKTVEEQYLSYTMEHFCERCLEKNLLSPAAVIPVGEGSWILIDKSPLKTESNNSGNGNRGSDVTEQLKRARAYKEALHQITGGNFELYGLEGVRLENGKESAEQLRQFAAEAVCGEEQILLFREWQLRSDKVVQPSWDVWETGAVHVETILDTKEKILAYLHRCAERSRLTTERLRIFRKELMQMTYNCLRRQNVAVATIFGDEEFDRLYEASEETLFSMDVFVSYVLEKLHGYNSQDNRQESVIEEICRYIGSHLKEEITRKKLAELVYLSEDYVSKLFSGAMGTTIPAYITRCRMDKAKDYLESTALTISQIALETGYTNFSYFSKNFRDYTGMTPNEFREQVKEKRITK